VHLLCIQVRVVRGKKNIFIEHTSQHVKVSEFLGIKFTIQNPFYIFIIIIELLFVKTEHPVL